MTDGNDGRAAVPDVCPGEVGILFLQDSELPCVGVHDGGKCGLESGQMGAAF